MAAKVLKMTMKASRGEGINKKQREKRKIKKTKVKRGIVENKDVNHSKTIEIKDNQNS